MSRACSVGLLAALALAGCGDTDSADACDPAVGDCPCDAPQAAALAVLHAGATLTFETGAGTPFEVGTSADPAATAPDTWRAAGSITLTTPGPVKVFARLTDPACDADPPAVFAHVYDVAATYPPAAGEPGSTALPHDDPAIVGWATGVHEVVYGAELDPEWRRPERALGPADVTADGVLGLGRGGHAVLTFDPPIADGEGADLAVFENGWDDRFLELAWVEVSSDGERFVRFANAYLGAEPVASFGAVEATAVGALAGKYRAGFGTPFDLAVLANTPAVRAGRVDLGAIGFVRIVDVVGDGSATDSFGHPIYDPYPTTGSAGFDLDAVAVLD